MAANDKAIELLTEGQEFLTNKVEELERLVTELRIAKASAEGRAAATSTLLVFLAGIIGSLLTHWATKALWP